MADWIRVLLIEPGEHPRLVTVEDTLENLQELVGGSIQAIYPWEERAALVCDDEGKYKGYALNRVLEDEKGNIYDVVAGAFFICGLSMDNFASLDDELADHFMKKFFWPELFLRTQDGHVYLLKMKPGEAARIIV